MIPKFRAWDKELQTMLDVSLIDFKKGVLVGEHWEFGETNFMNFDEIVLMQSTGLKDKNGQEIFEGDIVKRDGIKRPEVVRFGEWIDVDSLGYKEQYIGFYFESEHEGQEWLHSVEPQFNHLYKIIGNIYENPELLEVEG
nr:MAG TPA: YopX protein [Caudoviricetes sp.]